MVIISLAALLDSELLQVRVLYTVYQTVQSPRYACIRPDLLPWLPRWTPSSRAPRRESLGLGDTVIRTSFDQFFAF